MGWIRAHTGKSACALCASRDFAHGFQTLADDSEVFYQMSEFYAPDQARGMRWDDPLLSIVWPEPITVIAERDRTYPDIRLGDLEGFASLCNPAAHDDVSVRLTQQ